MEDQHYSYTPLELDFQLAGRYQIQQVLTAQGGFSLIYIAWDHQLGKHVIVKEVAPSGMVVRDAAHNIYAADESKSAVFARVIENSLAEAAVLRDLTERGLTGISSYIADFMEHQTHYIIMDLAEGRDLGAWNQSYREAKTALPVEFLTHVFEQLLVILQPIHEAGYFHCDIKPQNIHIDDAGKVTLIDFGAVRTEQRQHDDNVAISPGFSPPEFYPSHRAQIGPWTDIYMLGAMMYNLITRKVPEAADVRAVRDRNVRLAAIPGLLDRYPAPLLNSIDKAMSVEAKDRFADTETWQEFYKGLSEGRQVVRAQAGIKIKKGQIGADAMARSRRATGKPASIRTTRTRRHGASSEGGNGGIIALVTFLIIALIGVVVYIIQQQ